MCDVALRKIGRRGRRKRDWSVELKRVEVIPLDQRGSIRALHTSVGSPKTTLYELLKEDGCPTITRSSRHLQTSIDWNDFDIVLIKYDLMDCLRSCAY